MKIILKNVLFGMCIVIAILAASNCIIAIIGKFYLNATELKGKACFLLVPDFINYLVINEGITANDVEFILDILDKEEFLKPKS